MKTYIIKTIANKESLDWNQISKAEINEKGWTICPEYLSYAQMVFVENYGFIFKLSTNEKEPWANCLEDNGEVYLDSCLEAFLMFNKEGYMNFETNSLGKRLQFLGPDRNDRHTIIDMGYIAKVDKDSGGWSITIEIPLEKLDKTYKNLDVSQIKSGFSFKGNFYKTGKNPIDGVEHYYMWNRINTPNPDFHQPSQFGNLVIE